MSDYLIRLAAKSLNLCNVVLPRLASLYEPFPMDIVDTFDIERLESHNSNDSENYKASKLEERLQDEPGQASSRPLSVCQSSKDGFANDRIIEKDDNKTHVFWPIRRNRLKKGLSASAEKAFRDESPEEHDSLKETLNASDKEATNSPKTSHAKSKSEKTENAEFLEQTKGPFASMSPSEPYAGVQSPLMKESCEKRSASDEEISETAEVRHGEQQSTNPSIPYSSAEKSFGEHQSDKNSLYNPPLDAIPSDEGRIDEKKVSIAGIRFFERSEVRDNADTKLTISSADLLGPMEQSIDHRTHSQMVSKKSPEIKFCDRSVAGKVKGTDPEHPEIESPVEARYLKKGISGQEDAVISELSSVQADFKDSREKLTLGTHSPEISKKLAEVEPQGECEIDKDNDNVNDNGKEACIKPELIARGSDRYDGRQTNPAHSTIVRSSRELKTVNDCMAALEQSRDSVELTTVRQPLVGSSSSDRIIEKGDANTYALQLDKAISHGECPDTNAVRASKDESLEEMKVASGSDREGSSSSIGILANSKSEQTGHVGLRGQTNKPHISETPMKPSIVIQPLSEKAGNEKASMELGNEVSSNAPEARLSGQLGPSSFNPAAKKFFSKNLLDEKSLKETRSINKRIAVSEPKRALSRPSLASRPLSRGFISDYIIAGTEGNEIRDLSNSLKTNRILQIAGMNSQKNGLDSSGMKSFGDGSSEEMQSASDQKNPFNTKMIQANSKLKRTEYAVLSKQAMEFQRQTMKPHIAKPSLLTGVRSIKQEQQSIAPSVFKPLGKNPSDEASPNKGQIDEYPQVMQHPPLVFPSVPDIASFKRSAVKDVNTKLPFSSADLGGSMEQSFDSRNPEISKELNEVKSYEQSIIKRHGKNYHQLAHVHRKSEGNLKRQAFSISPLAAPLPETIQFIKEKISKNGKTAELDNTLASPLLGGFIKREHRRVSDTPANMPSDTPADISGDAHIIQPMNCSISEMKKNDVTAISPELRDAKDTKAKHTMPLVSTTSRVREPGINAIRAQKDTIAEGLPERIDIGNREQHTSASAQISLSQAEVREGRISIWTNNELEGFQSPLSPHINEIELKGAREISGKAPALKNLHSPFSIRSSTERAPPESLPSKASLFEDVAQREQGRIDPSTKTKPSSIRVTIGRVDVHAPPVERIIPMESPLASAKKLSLDDYLKMRNEGRL